MRRSVIAPQLESALRTTLQAPGLQLLELDGERTAHDDEAQPWVSVKYGPAGHDDWFGVVPAVAHFGRVPGVAAESLPLIVKTNPREGMETTFMPWIFERLGIVLDRPYRQYRQAAEFGHTAGRELATFDWPVAEIDEVLRALAAWQAVFWGAEENRLGWAGPKPTTADMAADAPLWRAIVDHGRARLPHVVSETVWRRRLHLIDTIADWHAVKDTLPATLAHNDFNQRNVGFRKGVLALDWELALRDTAHRDLVEFLTFVLPPSVDRAQVDHHVETHRMALAAAGVRSGIDRDTWLAGFRCELRVEALNRVGFQLVFGALYPLAYAERVNATIEHLLDLYG